MRRFALCAGLLLGTLGLFAGCSAHKKEDPLLRLSAEESLVEGRRLYELKKYGQARGMTMLARKIGRAVYQMLKRKESFDAVKFFAS